ncbi:MAG: carbohydrate kinase [Planctomycetota bacterium]
MSAQRPTIVSLGEVLWDLFPEGERFGGAPANFACHAALAGADVSILSAIGDDTRGRGAKELLATYGVDVSQLQINSRPTGSVGIELDSSGKPTFTIHENAAWDEIRWTAALEDRISQADLVYFGTLAQRTQASRKTIRRCLQVAQDAGIPTLLDVNLRRPYFDDSIIRDSIRLATTLKLSDEELSVVEQSLGLETGDPQDRLRAVQRHARVERVVLTRGAEGALLVEGDLLVDQPGFPTEVRDTVGAGDAFAATFAVGLINGHEPAAVMRDACRRAAAVCAIDGAVPPSDTIDWTT